MSQSTLRSLRAVSRSLVRDMVHNGHFGNPPCIQCLPGCFHGGELLLVLPSHHLWITEGKKGIPFVANGASLVSCHSLHLSLDPMPDLCPDQDDHKEAGVGKDTEIQQCEQKAREPYH